MLNRLHPAARRVLVSVVGVTAAAALHLAGTDLDDLPLTPVAPVSLLDTPPGFIYTP